MQTLVMFVCVLCTHKVDGRFNMPDSSMILQGATVQMTGRQQDTLDILLVFIFARHYLQCTVASYQTYREQFSLCNYNSLLSQVHPPHCTVYAMSLKSHYTIPTLLSPSFLLNPSISLGFIP